MARLRNKGVVYTGRVGVAMRPPRARPRRLRKGRAPAGLVFVGGPLDGLSAHLRAPRETLSLAINGQVGRYVNLHWHAAIPGDAK